jgi:hypothetical protein
VVAKLKSNKITGGEEMKIKVHNPNNLPIIEYTQLEDFQGDFKLPMSDENLTKLKNSIKKFGVFIPKGVWINEGKFKVLDGHQTKRALQELENEGYEIPKIPYIKIDASDKKDAVEKLLQINSKYADINPFTQLFESLDVGKDELEEMLKDVSLFGDPYLIGSTAEWNTELPPPKAQDVIPEQKEKDKAETRKFLICPHCGASVSK